MLCLAGLLRLRYVFVYPDSGDIVIAGAAEGWVRNLSGRVVGLTTGRPVSNCRINGQPCVLIPLAKSRAR